MNFGVARVKKLEDSLGVKQLCLDYSNIKENYNGKLLSSGIILE